MSNKIREINSTPTQGTLKCELCSKDPVERSFKWMLVFARILGLSPVSVSLRPNAGTITFRRQSFSTIHTAIIYILLWLLFLPQLWGAIITMGSYPTIIDELTSFAWPVYNFSLVAAFTHWLWNGPTLVRLMQLWGATMKKLNFTSKDNGINKFCLIMTIMLLGACFAENTIVDVFRSINQGGGDIGIIEKLYLSTVGSTVSSFLPHYSNITSLIFILANKIGYYSWSFSDVFMIILCRALSHKFKEMNSEMNNMLLELQDKKPVDIYTREQSLRIFILKLELERGGDYKDRRELVWIDIREKVLALLELAEKVAAFVGPILLTCYGFNILLIVIRMVQLTYEDKGKVATDAFFYISSIQYVLRVVLPTYFASEVYHSTERLLESLESYPDIIYCGTAFRIERLLAKHPVGIILFGSVEVTRRIFISILSFIFTADVVLLQAMSSVRENGANITSTF